MIETLTSRNLERESEGGERERERENEQNDALRNNITNQRRRSLSISKLKYYWN